MSPATTLAQEGALAAFHGGGWARRGPGFLREAREQAAATLAGARLDPGLAAFQPCDAPARPVGEEEVAPYRLPGAIELVFVDGHHVSALDRGTDGLRGLQAGSLAAALRRPTDALEHHLARHADADDPTVALNTAFLQDGGFVLLPRGAVVAQPIHLLHLATEPRAPTACHLRHLLVAGPQSQATIVESYVGLPS
ncbi:MAG TPA: hypothetical protein VHI93_08550, partial [Candidatus Thermoplasmatota archaeon]|nr:hypothetical protein [Candidatus Thermoplasmatota archaeon]